MTEVEEKLFCPECDEEIESSEMLYGSPWGEPEWRVQPCGHEVNSVTMHLVEVLDD